MSPPSEWHIFCRVVDNYGDAGVSFRLARQLANEHNLRVTLWIDNLATLAKIQPQIDPALNAQTVAHVHVRHLTTDTHLPAAWPAVIIDAFGGGLPQLWLDALARDFPPGNDITDARKPLWLILEYLSAETFVDEMHGKPSPPPNIDIPRYFFFPGFSTQSGGLLREKDLVKARNAFQETPEHRAMFLTSLGLIPLSEKALIISFFCYDTSHITELLNIWNHGKKTIALLVPEGTAKNAINQWHEQNPENALHIISIPFLTQDDYDRLLWSCDINFVRGEDSLIRAIWAGKPFIWQAYRQENNVHQEKVWAFLAGYFGHVKGKDKETHHRCMLTWNADATLSAADWCAFIEQLPEITQCARICSEQLLQQEQLATRLVNFCADFAYACIDNKP